jgi:hypothetical protein
MVLPECARPRAQQQPNCESTIQSSETVGCKFIAVAGTATLRILKTRHRQSGDFLVPFSIIASGRLNELQNLRLCKDRKILVNWRNSRQKRLLEYRQLGRDPGKKIRTGHYSGPFTHF